MRRVRCLTGPGSTYLEFDDVEVPVANLLGRENHGFEIVMSSKEAKAKLRIITTMLMPTRLQP